VSAKTLKHSKGSGHEKKLRHSKVSANEKIKAQQGRLSAREKNKLMHSSAAILLFTYPAVP